MNDETIRTDANNCFVCGPDHPHGLRIAFSLKDGICRGRFVARADLAGYDNMLHGGVLYSALDDVMANCLFLQGAIAHTARCEIRYLQPVAFGTELELEGRLLRRKGGLAILDAVAYRAGDRQAVARAEGRFMIADPGSLPDDRQPQALSGGAPS